VHYLEEWTMGLNLFGLLASYAGIFSAITVAGILLGRGVVTAASSRKIVHITVAHWWLLMMATIDLFWVAVIGPVSFIILNLISLKSGMFKAMEDPQPGRNYGTVYFPVSLLVLVLSAWAGLIPLWVGGVGILVMGWGDGLAALAGLRFGKRSATIFGSRKSLIGTSVMFVASFAVTAILTAVFDPDLSLGLLLGRALATAVFASMVELLTPFGVDNITVPILTAFFYRYVAMTGAMQPFLVAAGFNALFALAGWAVHGVDAGGAIAGMAVGTGLLASAGMPAFAILGAFFFSSVFLGRLGKGRRDEAALVVVKGGKRDTWQVLANGGVGLLTALAYGISRQPAFLVACGVAFAEATADTWASEIGVLSPTRPRSILSRKELPAGASGGVSRLGTLASLAGAVMVGLIFMAGYRGLLGYAEAFRAAIWVAAGGFAGAVIDSVLGATVQAQYECSLSGKLTERPKTDGVLNALKGGYRWVTNDVVNALSGAASALLAGLLYAVFIR
jgi:uncharacterized protein (TIGR00297 family)